MSAARRCQWSRRWAWSTIDHRFLLVTSANFSWSAEHGNVEFGVLIDNQNVTEAVERELLDAEDLLHERVGTPRLAPASGFRR
jgi:phosphatidylserine/phosphatidylglycerophosphate/cardiolipin synthase-like enzyme